MILSSTTIRSLCAKDWFPLINPFDEECLQGASYDVHLPRSSLIKLESPAGGFTPVSLHVPIELKPGAFCLAVIAEWLNVPHNMCANFHLCSTLARQGFEHALAGFIDPGYSGNLTVELKNNLQYSNLKLTPGMRIGQIVFSCLDRATDKPYQGRYQGATEVEEAQK